MQGTLYHKRRIKKQNRNKQKRTAIDPGNEEFYEYVKDIVHHPAVLQMKEFPHHCDTSCYQHCLNVAYMNYRICKSFHLDARAAARAGMLHDMFLYDWRGHTKKTGDHFHAMTHPKAALKNAKKYFEMSPLEEEIVLKHMWPVTIIPPRHPETYVICMTDKYCGSCEITDHYSKLPVIRKPYLLFRKVLKKVFGTNYQFSDYHLPYGSVADAASEDGFAKLRKRPSSKWQQPRSGRRRWS